MFLYFFSYARKQSVLIVVLRDVMYVWRTNETGMFEDVKEQHSLLSVRDTEIHNFNSRLFVCMWAITENVKKTPKRLLTRRNTDFESNMVEHTSQLV
jgi:hypothetical protein